MVFKPIKDPGDVRVGEVLGKENGLPRVGLIGAPWDGATGTRPGSRHAPQAVRQQLYSMPYRGGYSIFDMGDVDAVIGEHVKTWDRTSELARESLRQNAQTLVVGGDSTISYACHIGLESEVGEPAAYIMLDAHPDVRVVREGLTSGQVVRWIRSASPDAEIYVLGVRPRSNAAYLFTEAKSLGVNIITLEECVALGFKELSRLISTEVAGKTTHLSLNMDVVDPAYAPGVNSPSPGGFTSREILDLTRTLSSGLKPRLTDLVELTPPYDLGSTTALLASAVLLEAVWV